jgi:hypothetical protein
VDKGVAGREWAKNGFELQERARETLQTVAKRECVLASSSAAAGRLNEPASTSHYIIIGLDHHHKQS